MNEIKEGYSIAIPAYGRPAEYDELLRSIYDMNMWPNEIIICEDFSKERNKIREISKRYESIFERNKIKFTYIENEKNIGYDANIRKLIDLALYKWVILIGNDDLFLKTGLKEIAAFCVKKPSVSMISRPFVRFEKQLEKPLGTSRVFAKESLVNKNYSPKFIFRTCGFVGGLVINKNWAVTLATDKYDGTLFYQIYLASHAYCSEGIGYLQTPTVAGRSGNPPLFGDSEKDGVVHTQGSYSAKGRASMWKGVLDIAKDVGAFYNIELAEDVRQELMIRQSFHVFEMNVGVSRKTLIELKKELIKLNLFDHLVPKSLYYLNYIFGKNAFYFYYVTRKIMQ